MAPITILSEEGTATVEGIWSDGHVVLDPAALGQAIGWELKPQGLCRGDVCVPVVDGSSLERGGGIDLAATVALLGRPMLADEAASLVVLGVSAHDRRRALVGRELPPLVLPDLAGDLHSMDSWRGSKKLLIAFSSW